MTRFHKIVRICAIAFAIFLMLSILSGILSAVGALAGISAWRNRTESGGEISEIPIRSEIRELVMEIGAADIRIEEGSALAVETDNPYISVEEKNGKLIIREETHIGSLDGSSLTLYLPEDQVFDQAELTAGAGVIRADRLCCRELDLELGAGKAEIRSLEVSGKADITGGAGQILISGGEIRNLYLKMGVGECHLQASLTGDIDLEAGIGKLDLTVLGQREDYTVSVESGLGSIRIDGVAYGNTTIGSGEHRMEVEGGIGSVTIEFVVPE